MYTVSIKKIMQVLSGGQNCDYKHGSLGWKIAFELSTPSKRAHFELSDATFPFEIGPS